jgi:8-oxo-dGTP diphosphatase
MESTPTPIDRAFQVAFKVAHRLLRAYWTVRRPHKGGTLVAIWNAGEILIVKNTYRKQHTLPGGYPRGDETPAQTGARELAEECGVSVRPEDVRVAYRGEHLFEGRRDDVTIVEIELPQRPALRVDHREIAAAWFASPEEVLRLPIVPHLRDYLAERAGRSPASNSPAPSSPASA